MHQRSWRGCRHVTNRQITRSCVVGGMRACSERNLPGLHPAWPGDLNCHRSVGIADVPEIFPASFSLFTERNCGPRLASMSARKRSFARTLIIPRCSSFEFFDGFRESCQPEISASEVKL